MSNEPLDLSHCVLVLAPTLNDADVATSVLLEANIKALSVPDLESLCARLTSTVGALLLTEEALLAHGVDRLLEALDFQPSWSDLPIVLIVSRDKSRGLALFTSSGNISLLERPFGRMSLVRAVDVAMRARRKQYQIRDMMDQQIRATQIRDEFFATLSHELRTPLSVMLGWLEILTAPAQEPAIHEKGLQVLRRNANLQKGLIDDLLDMSRIISGKLNFEFKELDLAVLLRSSVEGFLPEAKVKGIEIKIKTPASNDVISGDEQRLNQAFTNIMTNAIKFTPVGGRITVSMECDSKECVIRFKDTGHGIEAKFLPMIFDRLKQEDMSSTRKHGGLGLGLAITAHILRTHEGSIKAESEGRNLGATIVLRLPLIQTMTEPLHRAEPSKEMFNLRGKFILAVDDSPDILELLQLLLERAEARVHSVHSGQEALEFLDHSYPDLIISDIGMPAMDGYQFIKTLRARPPEQGGAIPAIALTAYARDEERSQALKAGFQMHVSKPISNRELISAISFLSQPMKLAE